MRGRQIEGTKFSRQMPVGPYICDFLCREHGLVIEVDGGQHSDTNGDERRTRFLQAQGLTVIRFWNNEVLGNMEGVLTAIAEAIRSSHPPPTPSRMREGKSREAAKGWEE